MLDLHSHILPVMDDGSGSVEESRELVLRLAEQGVDAVAATSHFLPHRESADSFLERRNASFASVAHLQQELGIKIIPGAEVCYYEGISRLEGLTRLCFGEGNLLLLEMPSSPWTEYKLKELTELSSRGDLRVVIAHVERSIAYQQKDTFSRLLDCGIMFQINSSYIEEVFTRKKALSLLKNGTVTFLGSDCHGVEFRPPTIGKGFDIIKKKLGIDFLTDFDRIARSFVVSDENT